MVQKKRSSRSLKTKQLVQKFLVAALAPYKKNWGRAFEHNFFFFFFFLGGGGNLNKLIFNSSNGQGLPMEGGGLLRPEID